MTQSSNTFSGQISTTFLPDLKIEDLCMKYIPGYEVNRYDIVAMRVFAGAEFVVTIFAADKLNKSTTHAGKLMVKKFKILGISPVEYLNYIEGYNFTLFNNDYDVTEMEVINK